MGRWDDLGLSFTPKDPPTVPYNHPEVPTSQRLRRPGTPFYVRVRPTQELYRGTTSTYPEPLTYPGSDWRARPRYGTSPEVTRGIRLDGWSEPGEPSVPWESTDPNILRRHLHTWWTLESEWNGYGLSESLRTG